MNNNDFLTQLNEYLSQINEIADKANKLAEEYTASEQAKAVDNAKEVNDTDYTLDLLKDYVDAFRNPMYWIEYGDICHGSLSGGEDDIFAFENFPTEEYAKNLQKLNKFNGMMLAFKWCYDRDFEPDWNTLEEKYYVYYSNCYYKYDVASVTVHDSHNIYFSTEEIAQKCADWLNTIDRKGVL